MSIQIGKEMLGVQLPLDILYSIRLWALSESKSVTAFLTSILKRLLNNESLDPYDEDYFVHKISNSYLKMFDSKDLDWIRKNIDFLEESFEKLLRKKKLSVKHITLLKLTLRDLILEDSNDKKDE